MVEQLVMLLAILSGGVLAIYLLFWLLFKKDAPSIDDLRKKFEYRV